MPAKKVEENTEVKEAPKEEEKKSEEKPVEEVKVEEKKEERKFIMPCGNTDCRGYLYTQYKCDLCEHHTCAKCFEHIGPVKEEVAHTCKPENIESAEFIKKQSKGIISSHFLCSI